MFLAPVNVSVGWLLIGIRQRGFSIPAFLSFPGLIPFLIFPPSGFWANIFKCLAPRQMHYGMTVWSPYLPARLNQLSAVMVIEATSKSE